MKIVKDNNENKIVDTIEVASANYIGDYTIMISFNDWNKKSVDFKPFLTKSLHPAISKYLKEDLFKQFKIINGNLNWNDFDLIFPIYDLYEGVIG